MTTRLFRIEHEGTACYALELDGTYRLIDGDVFEGLTRLKQRAEAVAKAVGDEARRAGIARETPATEVVAPQGVQATRA